MITTHSTNNSPDTKPAYKQFWPWFLFILPATAVVASIYTLFIAQDMGHDKFLEGTQKIGRAVVSGPARTPVANKLPPSESPSHSAPSNQHAQ